jgi:flagellar basal-body rod protein FlgC
MSFMSAMEIISSGLTASRTRMNLISSNLANVNTTRTAAGGPYRRKDPVYQAAPLAQPFDQVLRSRIEEDALRGVAVTQVVTDPRPPRLVFDPGHPDADPKSGMVKMPNINVVEEMVDMIMASRAYEAGVTAMQSVKAMTDRALQIGR